MISSVSMSSSMSTMSSSSMQRKPPSSDQDVFKLADSDSNGLVSSAELATSVSSIQEITGVSIDVEEGLATFDADGDGSLSGEELLGLLSSQGFNPAEIIDSEDSESGMRPPPPPPPEQAMSAYEANSGEDTISDLMMDFLNSLSDSGEEYTSLALTA